MRMVSLRVHSQTPQPVAVMLKAEMELLTSVVTKNPRTQWVHVAPAHRAVYVCDGCRILVVEDTRLSPVASAGVGYIVPTAALKAVVKMMKAPHHVAMTTDPETGAVVLAIVESVKHALFGDDMALPDLGNVVYSRPEIARGSGPQGITIEGMSAMISALICTAVGPPASDKVADRQFFLTTEFMRVVGQLPRVVRSHTSELLVGPQSTDGLLFRTTGPEGAQWSYFVMPQSPRLSGEAVGVGGADSAEKG